MPRLDILVNNAGISVPEPALDQSLDAWDRTLAVNLRAPFLLSQLCARHMKDLGGGKIINIGSQSGEVGLKDHAAYCASKGGLHNLTRALAVEWGPDNINVNCVAPTVILTPMGQMAWGDPVKAQGMLDQIPLGRFGVENDVSSAVLFLASPAGDLVHGQILAVDGGFTAR
ncbi:MAG: short-chain dehydrogenase [Armatimonadetes bacterium CG_4_10_14_0_8_um_filter_66_14]|nr:SDR family oxidoreductase [Armatimonadota bacterium]PIW13689.1 MAG: short-chain dehydrogenase [Armatimonadetes bacterium CG17_big_fil_post_rev_8_21_14_2_50_66_6]PIZ48395.1 MAG: short-chain dehydrogenase [Armatimonadetes bacterium CG_4_10_14_0_8_um_filter_66_14]PJB60492.1 MAG: short-chain dehydrogenase [Armatimonadetes bacterium CG_4_9_14_3_um_filter_66_14]NCO92278.1 SDR family oxidoreductase [Armatimonadota bacterium]